MVKINCVVERITYQNQENGYSVLKVSMQGYDELVTVVGNLIDANVGSILVIEGDWIFDKKYGNQFSAKKWTEELPATLFGIEKYLGSGLIKGIGSKFAKRIVDRFGMDTISVIENSPEKLGEIDGIGKKRIGLIVSSWEQQKEIKNIMIFLQSHGVSTAFATKIYREYEKDSISIVKNNPYRLADDIWGIGFKTADKIAESLGFEKNCFLRCRSGLMYTLKQLANDGHVYAEREQLIEKCTELLQTEQVSIIVALEKALAEKDLILDEQAIYLPFFYNSETGTARRMCNINNCTANLWAGYTVDIEYLQNKLDIQYDEIQAKAIQQAVDSKIMVLTGSPGTGKTTTVLGIIEALEDMDMEIMLAAPTGRAAKRMTETTGKEAKTIHRLLEYNPTDGYKRNENNTLDGDVLIIDESSMIDIILMNTLLKAVPHHMKLIFVGDIDQLPSVGAGNVLRDIIDSGVFPVVRLTKIFRQAQASRIITNAHRINTGKFPDISNGRNTDFFYIESEDAEKASETIVDLVKRRLPAYYGVSSNDIQVLTPMRKGVTGAENLNRILQNALNPDSAVLYRGGRSFRVNDKVMQIRNNYDKEIFNGDIGIVTSINDEERTLTVLFDSGFVAYTFDELDELVQAYAITIHKSQGSEYPVVVMPVMMNHFVMLQRNLIYTGITRAKKILVLVGNKKAVGYAVRNVTVTKRNTKLRQRLQKQE
ncbi:MAG: ATP-dependent RecD-like DNA helicase [Ruminococcus sp.]|nr:ATP-dependent RecD-like DNA helicase [Ruminococcus sp.]MDE7099150.1 ATP-dependent RecD-like DNA helicase [Ruminococcus sp.]